MPFLNTTYPAAEKLGFDTTRLAAGAFRPRGVRSRLPQTRLSRWVRLFPIVFFLSYLNLTVAVFFFGPWPYQLTDSLRLIIFLSMAHCALGLGYLSAAFKSPMGFNSRLRITRLAGVSIIVGLIVLWPTLAYRTGTLFPSISEAINNPGAAYVRSGMVRAEDTPIIEYVRFFAGPLLGMLLPLTIFYWKRLSPFMRIGGILNIAGIIWTFIAMGTNKAMADILVLLPWLLLAAHLSGMLKLSFRLRATLVCLALSCCILFMVFYTSTQYTRPGSAARYGYLRAIGLPADRDNFMVRYLPERAQVGVFGFTGYLSHGYYALYLALKKPFVPMFGVGNSYFLFRQASRILNQPSIMHMPYPLRVQAADGWDAYGLWSTIYPWIASDVSFPGTILVVFIIGRLFAMTWLDTLRGENPFAVAMFVQLLTMLYYFSANNQCLQDGEGVSTFAVTLFMWLRTRRTRQSLRS